MKEHILTDKEVKRAWKTYLNGEGPTMIEDMRKALADFLNNRPESTIGKLRPIAEMSEKVPEGCFRVFYGRQFSADPDSPWQVKDADQRCNGVNPATHFQDIQLPTPDPEAEERQRFEEAMKGRMWMPADFEFKNGEYATPSLAAHYDTWKLAKAK